MLHDVCEHLASGRSGLERSDHSRVSGVVLSPPSALMASINLTLTAIELVAKGLSLNQARVGVGARSMRISTKLVRVELVLNLCPFDG